MPDKSEQCGVKLQLQWQICSQILPLCFEWTSLFLFVVSLATMRQKMQLLQHIWCAFLFQYVYVYMCRYTFSDMSKENIQRNIKIASCSIKHSNDMHLDYALLCLFAFAYELHMMALFVIAVNCSQDARRNFKENSRQKQAFLKKKKSSKRGRSWLPRAQSRARKYMRVVQCLWPNGAQSYIGFFFVFFF